MRYRVLMGGMGVFLSFCFLEGLPAAAAATPPDAANGPVAPQEETTLEKIVVTSRRTPVGLDETTDDVVLLSAEELDALPVRDLGEALYYVAGVDIQPGRGFGRGSAVTIHGSDSRHVRVMIDGIPLNNQASGQVDLSRFPLENIARVEVIKGPASSMWGSALGGVINVVTKETGSTPMPQGSLSTSFAEFQTRRHSAEVLGGAGSLGYYFSGSTMESAGWGPRDDVLQKNAFGKVSYACDPENRLTASFGWNASDMRSGVFPTGMWQAQPYRARYGKVAWEGEGDRRRTQLEVKYADQDITTHLFLAPADTEPLMTFRTHDLLYQLSASGTARLRDADLLVAGVDVEWHRLTSTYLGGPEDLTFGAPYVHYTRASDFWDLDLGLRFDYNSAYGKEWSPSFGALYRVQGIPETTLRFNVARAFNAPTLLWKHYDLALSGMATNPDIHAERAWVYTASAQSRPCPRLRIDLLLYRADVSEAIDMAFNGNGDPYMKNFERFRRLGAELGARFELTPEWRLGASAAFNDIEDRTTGDTVRGAGKARQSCAASLEYQNKKGLRFSVRATYDRWNEPPDAEPNDRKPLVDVKISQRLKNTTLFLAVHNVTNSKYWADYYFPIPPRYFEGGLSLEW